MKKIKVINLSPKGYFTLENWLFFTPLSIYEKMTYIILQKYSGFQKIYPRMTDMAIEGSMSRAQLKRCLSRLQKEGLISVISGKKYGVSNIYIIQDPTQYFQKIGWNFLDTTALPTRVAPTEPGVAPTELPGSSHRATKTLLKTILEKEEKEKIEKGREEIRKIIQSLSQKMKI